MYKQAERLAERTASAARRTRGGRAVVRVHDDENGQPPILDEDWLMASDRLTRMAGYPYFLSLDRGHGIRITQTRTVPYGTVNHG